MLILSIGSQAAHQSGEDEISLSTQGRTYTVDFHSMQQINEDTGTTRPVQRRLNPSSLSSNMVDMSAGASSGAVSNASVNDSGLLSTGMTSEYLHCSTKIIRSRGSSVSIVTDYGLDNRGSIPDRDRGFFF
jgi:hypothetical protein